MSLPRFTKRQIELMGLLSTGMRNREMAALLGITEYTAKNYLQKIYDLSGMSTRLELALWYVAHRDEILQSGNK